MVQGAHTVVHIIKIRVKHIMRLRALICIAIKPEKIILHTMSVRTTYIINIEHVFETNYRNLISVIFDMFLKKHPSIETQFIPRRAKIP